MRGFIPWWPPIRAPTVRIGKGLPRNSLGRMPPAFAVPRYPLALLRPDGETW